MKNLNNHVVICNWNEKSPELVRELHAEFHESSAGDWRTVVVIARNVPSFPDADYFGDTVLIPGDPSNRFLLERARVDFAHTVIILPDLTLETPDDEVLRIALTIRALLRSSAEKYGRRGRHVRVVAKVIDATHATAFGKTGRTGIDEVVCESDLGLRVLAQTSISPGLTYVLKDLLDYSRANSELYLTPLPEAWLDSERQIGSFHDVISDAFGHAIKRGRQAGVIPVGYLRHKREGGYDILINPKRRQWQASGFNRYRPGDHLLVLAIDRAQAHGFLHDGVVRSSLVQKSAEA